jgi:aspartate aminotransferase
MGYEVNKPQGGFYLFPRSPWPDDMEFIRRAQERNLLLVPGMAFGKAGFFRIAFCVQKRTIENSLPIFESLARDAGLSTI